MSLWKTFQHPNMEGGKWVCPICLNAEDKPVVLFPILGTLVDRNVECRQIHSDCLDYGLRAIIAKEL